MDRNNFSYEGGEGGGIVGALSFSVTDNKTTFGLCPDLPWTLMASS